MSDFYMVSKRFVKWMFIIFFLWGLLFILNADFFINFIKLDLIHSIDGSSHAAIGEYYAEHIFPKTWGWIPVWFGGMPFPQFYPPLFYFVIALFSKILPFNYILIFKFFILGLLFTIPILIANLSEKISEKRSTGIIAGIISVLLISDFSWRGYWGITLTSVFINGLLPQILGFVCLLLWLRFFLFAEQSRKYEFLSIIFLFLTILSNAHIAPIAGILFFVTIFIKGASYFSRLKSKEFWSWIFLYLRLSLIPFCLGFFWYLPMIYSYEYLVAISIPASIREKNLFLWAWPILLCLITLLLANRFKRFKNDSILILSFSFLIAVPFLFIDVFGSNFPIHSARWLSVLYALSPIIAGYFISNITDFINSRSVRILAIFLCLFPYFYTVYSDYPLRYRSQLVINSLPLETKDIIEYLSSKKGMVYIENFSNNLKNHSNTLNAVLGTHGISTNYTAFRESSVSSIFRIPLLNTMSVATEKWGIKSFLATDTEFKSQDIRTEIDRLSFMGIKHLLIRSLSIQNELEKSEEITLENEFGFWKLYQINNDPEFAYIPKYKPIVLFAPVNFKNRNIDSYDYLRFQEELFFQNEHEIVLAASNKSSIDENEDFELFKTAIIAEYKYKDLEKAYNVLFNYALNNQLFLLQSDSELFLNLQEIDNKNIHVIQRLNSSPDDLNPLRSQIKNLVADLKKVGNISMSAPIISIESTNSHSLKIDFDIPTNEKIPVIIKYNYFPYWNSSNQENVYLVSPTFMLIFANNDFNATFEKPKIVDIGYIISGISLFMYCVFYLWTTLYKRKLF